MWNTSYILVIIQWEIERHTLNLYGSWDCLYGIRIRGTAEIRGETIFVIIDNDSSK